MTKPYIICHMMSSVDGKIITANWGNKELIKDFSAVYEQCHNSFDSEAWMCGRVTMEKDFTKGEEPNLVTPDKPIEKNPFVGDETATSFAIAIDAHGKLGWPSNEISGDHVIEVLTENVTEEYLYYLQRKKVSYIFAGKETLDLKQALEQLYTLFPIKTIMLEGGGHVNGSLLNEGLVDELSLLVIPLADGSPHTPTTFEVAEYLQKKSASVLMLKEVKQLEHDVVWLKYHFGKD